MITRFHDGAGSDFGKRAPLDSDQRNGCGGERELDRAEDRGEQKQVADLTLSDDEDFRRRGPTGHLAGGLRPPRAGDQPGSGAAPAPPQAAGLPHWVVLDLMLPDGDGVAVLQEIREKKLPVKVAVVTGSSDPERLDPVMKLKPDAFLQKPVTADVLFNVIAAP